MDRLIVFYFCNEKRRSVRLSFSFNKLKATNYYLEPFLSSRPNEQLKISEPYNLFNSNPKDYSKMANAVEIENFYANIADPETLLSSSEALAAIKIYEKTVEIIGIVESVDNNCPSHMFKFLLRNDQGDKIQIFAWGRDADRIKGCVKVNFVTHIDGGYAKPKHSIWSKGTTKMDIHLVGNAVLNVLKKQHQQQTDKANIPIVQLEDVMSHTKETIAITGHLNSEVMSVTLKHGGRVGQTTIVQGNYKLEIKISSFENCSLQENDHVKIIGRIIAYGLPYMQVDDLNSISIIDDTKLSPLDLLRGTRIPKRKSSDDAE